MTVYTNFLGIDIGKLTFVVTLYKAKSTFAYDNTAEGIGQFIEDHKDILTETLTVLETTGGYELALLYALVGKGYKVHRADTRKVKSFIRSFGNTAKTDTLDARALARYGYERHSQLGLFEASSKESIELFQLVQRRNDLKAMLIAEKNRLKSPSISMVRGTVTEIIEVIERQMKSITDQIKKVIESNTELKNKRDVLKSIPGIGEIVAFELLILLPELGQLCRRKIASLAGVAPRANESGKYVGYRSIGHGRGAIKPVLFIAAMAARNSKTYLREFYEKLIANGKKKMVALTALMRKIIVIANAKLKSPLLH